MKITLALPVIAISLIGVSARPGQATDTAIEQMPAKLETQFALSALPSALRDQATVYLLDPEKGYQLSRRGTSGVTCLVERTAWELADFRDDIYIPLCYDAVGTKTYLKAIMDTATLRSQGMSPVALKAEVESRYHNRTYKTPEKSGLSYMVAPVMRTVGPPDMQVHTMPMPHLMFYAPNMTNADIGAVPDLSVHSSLPYPFIAKQGIAEQSYIIQLIGEAEKAKIMADEKTLLDDLSAPIAMFFVFRAWSIDLRHTVRRRGLTRGETMTDHKTGTREEWLAARLQLLEAEKELTRRSDELARRRQELPWVRIDKEYRFETDEGNASLADLFRGRSELLVYHFMFGPDYKAGCPSCSAIADGFDGFVVHLVNHDVAFTAVSRAPLAKLQAFKRRMGWTFPWASSLGSDFNFDFSVSVTEEQQREGAVEYNYRREAASQLRGGDGPEIPSRSTPDGATKGAAMTGTDVATYARERPGMSAFALEDGVVYHAYSTYARGLDGLWGAYQWLDRAPKGRNETGYWWRRHDEYGKR